MSAQAKTIRKQCSKLYYMPLLKTQRRQFVARHLAIYLPASMRGGTGAVAYRSEITSLEVVRRKDIPTPWFSRRGEEKYYPGELILRLLYDNDIDLLERWLAAGHVSPGMNIPRIGCTS